MNVYVVNIFMGKPIVKTESKLWAVKV